MQFVVSDDHPGLKQALQSRLTSAPWQRCPFHLLQNALHYVPKLDVRKEVAAWLDTNAPEGLSVLSLPEEPRRHLRTTNGLERLNNEIKRRTRGATWFPKEASLLRLVSAVLMAISED